MFFSLLAGLVIAFSLQLLLTNLGVALGLSAVGLLVADTDGIQPEGTQPEDAVDENAVDRNAVDNEDDGESSGYNTNNDEGFSPPVTHLLGLGVTLSVAPVLFAASFLATEFSQFESFGRGIIFGTILWSTYLLIVTWLSSKTVSGIADVVLGGATAGIRKLFSAVKQMNPLGSGADDTAGKTTESLTEAERVSMIAREIGAVMSTQDYLPMLVSQRKEDLIQEMSDRAQLSPRQAETIIRQLSGATSTAHPSQEAATAVSTLADTSPADTSLADTSRYSVPDWRKLMRMGLNQLDITDWDLESAWSALQTAKGVQEALPFNIISLDVEDYLSEIPQWVLASDSLETDLVERLYDPEADPELVLSQLKSLKPDDLIQWLVQRGDLSDEAIQSLGGKLSGIYHSVLDTVEAKTQTALTQSSKAASATRAMFSNQLSDQFSNQLSNSGSAVKVLKHLGTTAEQAASTVAKKVEAYRTNEQTPVEQTVDSKITSKSVIGNQTANHKTTDLSQLEPNLPDVPSDRLKRKFSEVQRKLLSYFRYTTLDKLTAESVGEKLKSQLESSDLLTESGMISLGDEPTHQTAKDWIEDWLKTSSEELEIVISKRKGITKKQLAALKESLKSSWRAHYAPSFSEDTSIESQSDQNNNQRPGFPRRWAQRVAQGADQSLAHKLITGDWRERIRAQLANVADQGSEAVESTVGGAFETVETAVTDTLEAAQGQFSEAIASAQQKIEAQVEATKHELQAQAEAVRHQAAIAAWWLFISLLTSELAAASAGWLAVRYPVG